MQSKSYLGVAAYLAAAAAEYEPGPTHVIYRQALQTAARRNEKLSAAAAKRERKAQRRLAERSR